MLVTTLRGKGRGTRTWDTYVASLLTISHDPTFRNMHHKFALSLFGPSFTVRAFVTAIEIFHLGLWLWERNPADVARLFAVFHEIALRVVAHEITFTIFGPHCTHVILIDTCFGLAHFARALTHLPKFRIAGAPPGFRLHPVGTCRGFIRTR